MRNEINQTELHEFLVEFAQMQSRLPKRRPTFLEIAKIAHREVQASNIRRFFLDPNAEHNLGTHVLKALCDAAGLTGLNLDSEEIDVRTEESTTDSKRLDIVVEGRSFVIGIENKLHSTAGNPIESYEEHLRGFGKQHTKLILLALHREQAADADRMRSITYDGLWEEMMKSSKAMSERGDSGYLLFLSEWIRSIDHQKTGTTMDPETYFFFKKPDNEHSALATYRTLRALEKEMAARVQGVKTLMEEIDASCISFDKNRGKHVYLSLDDCAHDSSPEEFWVSFGNSGKLGADRSLSWETTLWLNRGWEIRCWRTSGFDTDDQFADWLTSLPVKSTPDSDGARIVYKTEDVVSPPSPRMTTTSVSLSNGSWRPSKRPKGLSRAGKATSRSVPTATFQWSKVLGVRIVSAK